jgi:flagellar hook assembly protein FlgD
VDLAVYDAAGRLVQHLAHGTLAAGDHSFAWDGRTANRGEAAAGVYFVRLHSASRDLDTRVVKLH